MIRISNISMKFNPGSVDEVVALAGVDLEIGDHEFVTVIGTNGSGKSTLLNMIAGSVHPDNGTVEVGGHDLTSMPDYRRAGSISRVFQNPYTGTAPGMTIAENMLLAWYRGRKHYPKISLNAHLKRTFRDRLADLGMQLENRLDQVAGTLSGGQRQALTLLMAVMQTPQVLLLDEHTAALDPKSAAQIVRLTRKYVTEGRLTTLMVTHSMAQALELGSRTIMMHQGRIIEDLGEEERKLLTTDDLNARFEAIRKRENLTPGMIAELRSLYL